jgi:hypothetical protein
MLVGTRAALRKDMKHPTPYNQEHDLAPLLSELQALPTDISSKFGLPLAEAEEIAWVVGAAILQEHQSHNRMNPGCDEANSNGAWLILRPNPTLLADACTHGVLVPCSEIPRSRITFPLRRGLELLGRHLEACLSKTKIGIVLTDCYRPTDFKWNEYALRNAQQRGQYVVTVLRTKKKLAAINSPWD